MGLQSRLASLQLLYGDYWQLCWENWCISWVTIPYVRLVVDERTAKNSDWPLWADFAWESAKDTLQLGSTY
jgi:hypothetical protein